VFELIGDILKSAGMGFGDVVKVDTFLTHMPDFEKYSPIRNRFFSETKPVSTLIEVKGLARPGCCIEIEVLAIQ
jgi:enamine deaminase RidA (YjgF/YER057c/UK114 family)